MDLKTQTENHIKEFYDGELPKTELGMKLMKIITNEPFQSENFTEFTKGWIACVKRLESFET